MDRSPCVDTVLESLGGKAGGVTLLELIKGQVLWSVDFEFSVAISSFLWDSAHITVSTCLPPTSILTPQALRRVLSTSGHICVFTCSSGWLNWTESKDPCGNILEETLYAL